MSLDTAEKSEGIVQRVKTVEQQRDRLLVALMALLEHEGTVESTGIGEFPSQALCEARRHAEEAVEAVQSEILSGPSQ